MNSSKIINDPVFGFITVPSGLLLKIVKHPFMQRLTRIRQLGMASVVYPGAQHTRFHHSLGAFHLMSEAVLSLRSKGVFLFDGEAEAVQAAILMHDIGHGPFSHVLEHALIKDISHEKMSLLIMQHINDEMHGALTLALRIFQNEYQKQFLHQLISSQVDMDRLDYLCRDSFFTGVTEASIGSARIIKMLNVYNDRLVIDYKGIHSIENYLISRRLMYWQVYLHKATVACEKMLVNVLLRARKLINEGHELFTTPALRYFLYNNITADTLQSDSSVLDYYMQLDDNDIWSSIKAWRNDRDFILSLLSRNLTDRQIFKVEVRNEAVPQEEIDALLVNLSNRYGISKDEARYLMSVDTIGKDMYNIHDDHIQILYPNDILKDITEASEILKTAPLSHKSRKFYLCYQRF